jgi:hypothetical protein
MRREKNESARTPVRVMALVEQPSPESALFQLRLCRKLREWPESARGGTTGPSARTRDALNLRSGGAYYGRAFDGGSGLQHRNQYVLSFVVKQPVSRDRALAACATGRTRPRHVCSVGQSRSASSSYSVEAHGQESRWFCHVSGTSACGRSISVRASPVITIEPIPHVDAFEAGGQTYRRLARPEA